MIEILTALQAEAAGLIRLLDLRKIKDRPFRQYEGAGVRLTVTGVGKAAAAAAVGTVLSGYTEEELRGIQLVNFGSCGAACPEPKLFLLHKLTDADTGRTFYPDLLVDSSLPEAEGITGSRPWQGKDRKICRADILVYDMEASAIYEAGQLFVGPDRLHFLKGVTDADGRVSREAFTAKMAAYAEEAAAYLTLLVKESKAADDFKGESGREAEFRIRELSGQLAADLHASVTMEHEIRQLVRYGVLAGLDGKGMYAACLAKAGVDADGCRDRREGKKVLAVLRRVLSGEESPVDAKLPSR